MELDPIFIGSIIKVLLFSFLFVLAAFVSFYIPGNVILGKYIEPFKNGFPKFIISSILGIILWSYQGLIFGYLGFRFLTYFYLLIFFLIWLRKKPHNFNFQKPKINKESLLLILVFVVGTIGQIYEFFISSFITSNGIYSNMEAANDSLLHTAYIVELARRFPPFEPGMAGEIVKNYHYLGDFVLAELVRVFHLPLFPTQFLYMSIFLSLLFGGAAYVVAKLLNFSNAATIVIVYLQYFSSDVIYLITFATSRIFDFTTHPLMDGTMFLENPPRAFSFVAILGGLSLLFVWLKTKSTKIGLLTIITLSTLVGFKINTAFAAFGGIYLLILYLAFKKQWKSIVICVLLFIISYAIYAPVNGNAGFLIYDPFNITRMFAVQPKLQTSHLELARQIYSAHKNTFGQIRYDLIMLALFLVGQFGIVNLGLIPHKKLLKLAPLGFFIFLYGAILTEIIVGSTFLQPVGLTNSFNFYLPIAVLLSVPAAFLIGELLQNRKIAIKILVILILIVCTIPRFVSEINAKTVSITKRLKNQDVLFATSQLEALAQLRKKQIQEILFLSLIKALGIENTRI